MTDTAPTAQHLLMVSLRGQDHCVGVPMRNEDEARAAILWFSAEFLRRNPSDRSAAWLLGVRGENVIVTQSGVATEPTFSPHAAFDPREVVGVIYHQRKEGEKWE